MKIYLLIRTFFRERFSPQRVFGRRLAESNIQKFFMVAVILYAFISTSGSVGVVHYQMALSLLETGNMAQLWFNVFSYLTGIAFIFAFFQAQGTLFHYKDFDLLGALPLTQKTITLAKIFIMLIVTHIFSSIFVIPIVVVVAMFITMTFMEWIVFVLIAFLLPIPMMMIGSFVSLWIRRLTQRWLHPQVMQTLMTIAFILTLLGFTYFQNQLIGSGLLSPNSIRFIQNIDLSRTLFAEFLVENNFAAGLILLILLIVITLAFVQLMSMVTLKTNQQQPSQHYQAKENKPTKMYSLLRNLITKEWKRFINSSIYVVNTSFGLFILVIAAIAAVFARPQIDGILLELGVAEDSLLIALTGLIVFTLVTVYTPAVSLSLEGKNFSLIKSLPLDYRTLFDAKIAFNVLLTIIPLAFAIVLFSIAFNLTVMETVMLFVMMVIFSYAISVVDMWINIFFPRFDFQHEVEVVKQSMAAMISVLGGFGIFGAAIYAHIILLASMSWLFSSLIVSFIVFVIGIGLHSVLHHRANKVIQQLEV